MNIKITSDSTCDLSPALLEQYDISIAPLVVTMAGKSYRDGVDIHPADIFANTDATGELSSTAAVNVADYQELWQGILDTGRYDAIIHITISADFSSCYQNACLAAEEFSNVYVVDSRNLSSGHGHVVVEAGKRRTSMEPQALCEFLRSLTARVETSFVLDRLDYMAKGGRCSAVALLGANMLQLKPCIEVADGKMRVAKKYRGSFQKCLAAYIRERLEGRDDIIYERIFITHPACTPEDVQLAEQEIKKWADFEEIIETRAGCTVSCHCGPSTLGVLFIRSK